LVQMRQQAELAIAEADVIIFIVDGKEGITHGDEELAQLLFRSKKSIVLAVNKIDNLEQQSHLYEFYSLGCGEPMPISGSHGLGIGDLLDQVTDHFPTEFDEDYDETTICFSLIGRPNVGKSSLVNGILGHERVIVSPIPGTTRD